MRFDKKYPKSKKISTGLQDFFDPKTIEEKARACGFVKRKSPLTGAKFVQLCIGGITEKGITKSLTELCSMSAELGVEIVKQSLDERFNDNAIKLFKELFDLALEKRFDDSELKILNTFSQIILEDSTICQLPENLAQTFRGSGGSASTSKAAVKIDYTYDLKTDYFNIQLVDGKQNDMSIPLPNKIVAGSLWLRDLGYFKTDDFLKLERAGAFYLSRFKHDRKIFLSADKDAKVFNLSSQVRKLRVNEVKDLELYVGSKRHKTRVVIQRVPAKVAKKRKAHLLKQKAKKGWNVSKERLALCELSVFITNLKEEWKSEEILKFYKVRWQIEVIFKVWKSVLQIGQVKKMKSERIQCLLYAQLIWAIINMRIFHSFKVYFWNKFKIEISEIKTYKIMKNQQLKLLQAIYKNRKNEYVKYLNLLFRTITKLGKKEYKKENPYPLFHLEAVLA